MGGESLFFGMGEISCFIFVYLLDGLVGWDMSFSEGVIATWDGCLICFSFFFWPLIFSVDLWVLMRAGWVGGTISRICIAMGEMMRCTIRNTPQFVRQGPMNTAE